MSARPTLKQLEAFVELSNTGHFAETARRLNTTQPNISSRIAALEALVGGQVIDRARKPLRPTPLGLDLLPFAKGALDQVTRLTEASQNPRLRPAVLRLGLTELAEWALLTPVTRALTALFPDMLIETRTGLSVDIEQDVQAGNLDMAICNAPFLARNLDQVPIIQFPWAFVAAPQVAARGAKAWLTSARETQAYAELQQQVPKTVRLVPGSSLLGTRLLALAGQGIAILPEIMVAEDLANGALVKLETGKPEGSKPEGGRLEEGRFEGRKSEGGKLEEGEPEGRKFEGGELEGSCLEEVRVPGALAFSILHDPARPGAWLAQAAAEIEKQIHQQDMGKAEL